MPRVDESIGTARPSPTPATAVLMPTTRPPENPERAAGVARVQGGVGLDHVLDEAAFRSVARREGAAEGGHDAGRHRSRESQRIADRNHELAHL